MIAAFSPGSDFKRYYRGRMPRLAFVVILLMPLMYGALYLWAFWDPFGNVDKVPVAIVNLDKGAKLKGEKIDAGSQVLEGLVASGQLNLTEVSEEEAKRGLAHGDFDFTITIPANFSASVVSAAGSTPKSAELIFTYDETNNYLSTVIGQDAAEEVINQVSAQVGEQVFSAVVVGVENAIPKLESAAKSVEELNSGMEQANDGAQLLATNLVTADSGAQKLASGIDEIVEKLDGVIGDATQIIDGSGITGDEIRDAVARIQSNVDNVSNLLDGIAEAHTTARTALDDVIMDLRAEGLDDFANRVQEIRDRLDSSAAITEIGDVFDAVRSDVGLLADQLGDPGSKINIVMRAVEDGAVVDDLAAAQNAAGQLRSGADKLSSGISELSTGATKLAKGTPKLAAGTEQLSEAVAEGLKLIPHWNNAEQDSFVKTLAQPVKLIEKTENEAKTFAYGFAPFFIGLALFVGSIIAWMLFTPLQARPLAQGLGSFRTTLASFAPTLVVGAVQATILFLTIYFGLGLTPEFPVPTLLFMWLMVAMFLAMIQMLNALFGAAVGRVITLAVLMIMLTSAGGIYPVQTTSPLFQWIHPYDPMTYTVTGLRQLIMGGIDERLAISILVIAGITALFLAITTWAARRNRQYNMDRLYPQVEV